MSTPLTSIDPKDILNAASCFVSCVPTGYNDPLKSYLLTNAAGAATGPCVTPSAPTIVSFGSPTDTTLTLVWVQAANVGSIIFSYTVKLGTAPGGPYTITRTTRVGTKHLVITGLTAGTTYYAVVVANSFSGCSSANSGEFSATTTGMAATGLLGYWKLDENPTSATWADATGNGWNGASALLNSSTGIINGGPNVNGGTTGVQINAGIDVRAQTTPFTFYFWFKPNPGGLANGDALMGEWGALNDFVVFLSNASFQASFTTKNVAAVQTTVNSGVNLVAGTWYFIVAGYDGTNIFIQVNNSARVTALASGVNRGGELLTIGNYSSLTLGASGIYDEASYWDRALSTVEVTGFYNGGAASRPSGI